MSRFPADWLRLREPFDHAARSSQLVEALIPCLPAHRPLRVVELGAGLGSGMRYVAPQLPGAQHWTLVDHDAALLAAAGPPPASVEKLTCLEADLRDPRSLSVDVDLVSTQALLDLVSESWLTGLAQWVSERRLPLLAALSVDGRVDWHPQGPLDGEIQDAFAAHQLTDRGFGASPGPRAAACLAEMLRDSGYTVTQVQADWEIGPAHTQMLTAMISGTAAAAREAAAGITTVARVNQWEADRIAAAGRQELSLTVGHIDLLATP